MLKNIDIVILVLIKHKVFIHVQNNEFAQYAGPGGWNDPDSKFTSTTYETILL